MRLFAHLLAVHFVFGFCAVESGDLQSTSEREKWLEIESFYSGLMSQQGQWGKVKASDFFFEKVKRAAPSVVPESVRYYKHLNSDSYTCLCEVRGSNEYRALLFTGYRLSKEALHLIQGRNGFPGEFFSSVVNPYGDFDSSMVGYQVSIPKSDTPEQYEAKVESLIKALEFTKRSTDERILSTKENGSVRSEIRDEYYQQVKDAIASSFTRIATARGEESQTGVVKASFTVNFRGEVTKVEIKDDSQAVLRQLILEAIRSAKIPPKSMESTSLTKEGEVNLTIDFYLY